MCKAIAVLHVEGRLKITQFSLSIASFLRPFLPSHFCFLTLSLYIITKRNKKSKNNTKKNSTFFFVIFSQKNENFVILEVTSFRGFLEYFSHKRAMLCLRLRIIPLPATKHSRRNALWGDAKDRRTPAPCSLRPSLS